MSEKQPKKKPASNKTTNDSRPNRKAFKQKADDLRPRDRAWRGNHTRKNPLDDVQKVLLGGGMLRNVHRTHAGSIPGAWKFGGMPTGPYDPKQVEINRRLYPHLFTDK